MKNLNVLFAAVSLIAATCTGSAFKISELPDLDGKLEAVLSLLAEQSEFNRKQDERIQQQEMEIRQLRESLDHKNTAPRSIDGQPESCEDLSALGHTLSGFYSVRGDRAIESVFCDFSKSPSDSGFQMDVGSVDVKSPVYFYVQRTSDYHGDGNPMPFQIARVNVGDAMNISSGIFTVPKDGVYFFSFNGVKSPYPDPIYLNIMVNGYIVSSAFNGAADGSFTVSLFATLHLTAGDQVYLKLNNIGVFDDNSAGPYTHFTGMLLHQDLSF